MKNNVSTVPGDGAPSAGLPKAPAEPLPWLRQLFSITSINYYVRSIIWVLILILLTSAMPLLGVPEFTALRSIILYIALIVVLVILKLFRQDLYASVCWYCLSPSIERNIEAHLYNTKKTCLKNNFSLGFAAQEIYF